MAPSKKKQELQSGYIDDVVYPAYPWKLQNPLWLSFIAACNGHGTLPFKEHFSYLELGCADGHNLNVYADLFPDAEFTGIDFNAAAIEKAKKEADAAGLKNVTYHAHDIADLAALNLAALDYVVCVGTFAWLGPALREAVLAQIPHILADGGLFFLEHAVRPGSNMAELLCRIAQLSARQEEGSITKMRAALSRLEALQKKDAPFFADAPGQAELIKNLKSLSGDERTMVRTAHAWLSSFEALYHADIAGPLSRNGVNFAGSGRPVDYLYLSKIEENYGGTVDMGEDEIFRQTLLDAEYRKETRADVYIKSAPAGPILGPPDRLPDNISYAATRALPGPVFKGLPKRRPIEFGDEFFSYMLQFMTVKPVSLEAFCSEAAKGGIGAARAQNGLWLLIAGNYVEPVLAGRGNPKGKTGSGPARAASPLIEGRVQSYKPEAGDVSLPGHDLGTLCTLNSACTALLKAYLSGEKDLKTSAMRTLEANGYPLHLTQYLYPDAAQYGVDMEGIPQELQGMVVSSENDMAQIIDRVIPRFREYILPDLRRLGVIN